MLRPRCSCVSILFVLSGFWAMAQDRAAVNGTVTDPTGAVIPDASVDLRSAATGFHRTANTGENGFYEFPGLAVGRYSISVAKPGFHPLSDHDIDVLFAQTRTVDASLEIGTTSETVDVIASADALNRANAEVGTVIGFEAGVERFSAMAQPFFAASEWTADSGDAIAIVLPGPSGRAVDRAGRERILE